MTTAPAVHKRIAIDIRDAAVVGTGAVLLLLSMVGIGWLVAPANPASKTPSTTVSFADLTAATDESPSTVQATYFGWLAWLLFGAIIVLTVAVLITRSRPIAISGAAMGVLTLLLTTLALKGPQTWMQTVKALPDLRLGGYLMLVGVLILTIFNTVVIGRSRTDR
jgi:hypothetical protein